MRFLTPYFALISCLFASYMPSWIKGGGMESDFTYFLILALLVIPSQLEDIEEPETSTEINARDGTRCVAGTATFELRLGSPQ